jgi:glutamate synthase domain-containing protein 3
VGERFAVRNSGATAVVEGCGDHGCEYMTGGVVVVLGETGRNFGAGMTGGEAFDYDDAETLPQRYNTQLVTITRVAGGDADRLRGLVAAHYEATGSRRARMLLGNWEAHLMRFWKVAPKAAADYGRSEATARWTRRMIGTPPTMRTASLNSNGGKSAG